MTESLGRCIICGGHAVTVYPLLPGEPAFCSGHHNPRDAGPFGCDFTGPDDFDIPDEPYYSSKMFSKDTFVWTDRQGVRHRLVDIDDRYLQNIVGFLRRRTSGMEADSTDYWLAVTKFLESELSERTRLVGA